MNTGVNTKGRGENDRLASSLAGIFRNVYNPNH